MKSKNQQLTSFNVLFGALLLACFALSFIAPNNLDEIPRPNHSNLEHLPPLVKTEKRVHQDSDTISMEALQKFLDKELVKPVHECMEKKDPHVFMTKCYSKVYFELDPRHANQTLYNYSNIQGTLLFMDCSVPTQMAQVLINMDTKEIFVKESFRAPKVKASNYTKDICKFIMANGIPEHF